MADGTIGGGMQMAGGLLQEMVMQEAIKDKSLQVQKQLEDAEGNVIGHNQQEIDYNEDKKSGKYSDSDSDFNSDGDDAMLKSLREQRIEQMKKQQ